MFHSRISVIEGHARDRKTEELYEPLRKTFLADTTAKKSILDDASKVSHISHLSKPHTYAQNHRLGEQTFILQDVTLRPTHHYEKLPKNRVYSVINAQQKVLAPISEQQLKKRTQKFQQQQVIVYTYGDQDMEPLKQPPTKATPVGAIKTKNTGIKVTQAKYNLFSLIDEPINNLLTGKSCTCPANQLIASQRSQVNWDDIKHHHK